MRPKRLTVSATKAFTAFSSLTSVMLLTAASGPCCWQSDVASAAPFSMSAIITRAPSFASARE
jgi:hypothetical protein